MQARTLFTLGTATLALSLAKGGYGLMTERDDLVRAAVLLAIPAATALVLGALRHNTTVADDQLAAAHTAGYTLALDHVARGLLDQHTAPAPDGTRGDHTPGAHVHHLYPLRNDDRAAG